MRSLPNPYPDLTKKSNRQLDDIPGDYGPPLIGYTREMFKDVHGLIQRQADRYGPVYKSANVFQRTINLLGPEANKFVLSDSEKNFSNKLAWDYVLDKLFPNGLMLRDFDEHRLHRRILQQAFKKPVLARYVENMDGILKEGIAEWPKGQYFCFFENIKTLMLESAIELFLGESLNSETQAVNQAFIDLLASSLAIVRLPVPGTNWYRGMKGRAKLEQFFESRIAARKQSPGDDFFSQFCMAKDEDGNSLNDIEIVDHMIFLLFAAHDTITSTLSTIINLLITHPEWQIILQNEYQQLNQTSVSFEDLAKLEKTEWVIKEALRLIPPVPVIPRRAIRECEFGGYTIPKNASVCVHPPHTHRMEELWTNPNQFDPGRWSSERAEASNNLFQFIPFGGGAHKCLGLNFAESQAKVFLFQLLSQYTITSKAGHTMEYQLVPLSMPKNGLPIKLTKKSV